jgi:hypothetical protein
VHDRASLFVLNIQVEVEGLSSDDVTCRKEWPIYTIHRITKKDYVNAHHNINYCSDFCCPDKKQNKSETRQKDIIWVPVHATI